MAIFKELVQDRIKDPRRTLIRLIRYTDGEVEKLIRSFVQQTT